MPYSAKAIANEFLSMPQVRRAGVSPMKLQKLVYFAHAWHLAIKNQPLINEHVEAWEYGPVIPSVYHEFKRFGNEDITESAKEYDHISNKMFEPSIEDFTNEDNEETKALLDRIWEIYGPFSAIQLSNMTHTEDSPWYIAYNSPDFRRGMAIDNNVIADYFKHLLKSGN